MVYDLGMRVVLVHGMNGSNVLHVKKGELSGNGNAMHVRHKNFQPGDGAMSREHTRNVAYTSHARIPP